MQNSLLKNYRAIAGQLGLGLDEEAGAFTGSWNGWPLCIYPQNANYPYNLTIAIAAGRADGGLTREELGRWDKKRGAVSQKGNTVLVSVTGPAFRVKADAVADKLRTSLDAAAAMLTELGFHPVCASCGQPKEGIRGYQVQTDLALLCPDCAARTREALDGALRDPAPENLPAGLLGGLLGSLAGVACIIVLSRLGFVAALSGLVMAVCTLRGYGRFGGGLSKKGVALCCLLMAAMVYLGDRLDWAIVVMRDLGYSVGSAFSAVHRLVDRGIIDAASYWGNLAMLYLFTALGAVPTVLGILRGEKARGVIRPLNGPRA